MNGITRTALGFGLVDAETKKILGAALLGIEGDEVIHSSLDMMYAGSPYTVRI